jgi:hypothetical protein
MRQLQTDALLRRTTRLLRHDSLVHTQVCRLTSRWLELDYGLCVHENVSRCF